MGKVVAPRPQKIKWRDKVACNNKHRQGGPGSGLTIFLAYDNVCWRTRLRGKSGWYRRPAVMAAGIADRLWSFEDLYDAAMGGA